MPRPLPLHEAPLLDGLRHFAILAVAEELPDDSIFRRLDEKGLARANLDCPSSIEFRIVEGAVGMRKEVDLSTIGR